MGFCRKARPPTEEPVAKFPFEASLDEILCNPDPFVDAVFSCLESEFLVMPRGAGFVEYAVFERGYEALKGASSGFSEFDPENVYAVSISEPISVLVLRTMLGLTASEWGYIATQRRGIAVLQGFVRTLDRKIRMQPASPLKDGGVTGKRLKAMVVTACELLRDGMPQVRDDQVHRLDKADTRKGVDSIRSLASIGVPYAMLLYERYLGRPFAGHRDSVSELIGGSLESAVEDVLTKAGVSCRKTKRAERLDGFDQTPDFIVPSEFNPQIVIEAKITEDDGTARDKVTRIQHLAELSMAGRKKGDPKYEVIACIGGRGFGVRREDMKKMIIATRGKVFTVKTIEQMVSHTRLSEFASA